MKIFTLIVLLLCASSAYAQDEASRGETLYLPVYSKIWHGDLIQDNKYPQDSLLSALISVRNTSLKTSIRVISARYYSTDGKLIKEYIATPKLINPMGTLELFVERRETAGGSGANFIIQWDAATATNAPIVQAVHADIRGGSHALSFITTARPVQTDK